jgi:glycosyltransferase involved in cell wall biosynthesis
MSELDKAASKRTGWGTRAAAWPPVRLVARVIRGLLVRYARAQPREEPAGDGPPRVTILTVSGWGKGGTTRTMLNLAGYLAPDHEVEIISLWRTREEPFFEHPDGVPVYALDDLRPAARPRGLRGLPARVLGRLPSVLAHPGDRWATSFSLLSDVRLVRKLRRRTGMLLTTRPALNLIAGILDPPGLITIGGEHMHLNAHSKDLRKAMARVYRRLDAFAVLTETAKRDYEKFLNGNDVKLVRIPNAARDLGEPADLDAKRVLAAGRLTRQKGFDRLLPAWAQVERRHPDWTLRICGEGMARERLEGLIEEHGLKNVELPGSCDDMGAEMSNASIFALSSRFEGFPLILLEAMSKGMAPVSFDCPTGPDEVIDDGRNGLIVPPDDVDAFAAALLRMVEDDELRHRCGPAAAETARAFSMDAIGAMWDELFRELQEARTAALSSVR